MSTRTAPTQHPGPPPPADERNLPRKPASDKTWQQVVRGGKGCSTSRVSPEEINKLKGIFKDKITISREAIEEARKPWQFALIGHFLGRQRDTDFVARSLGRQWQTLGDVEVIPLTDGFFTFWFVCEDDIHGVWTDGPWTVGGMVLSLEEWKPSFRPSRDVMPKAAV